LPAFERLRERYLDDRAYAALQSLLLLSPEAGDVIEGTGGLRKLRFGDAKRGKGKRSGLRVIFTLYNKDEADDLTPKQRTALREFVKTELKIRSSN